MKNNEKVDLSPTLIPLNFESDLDHRQETKIVKIPIFQFPFH